VSSQTAVRVLLRRLSAGQVALVAVLLDLPTTPVWADGRTEDGRSVVLVGRHALGDSDDARALVDLVLAELGRGHEPAGVHVLVYLPQASRAIAEIVDPETCWSDDPDGVVDGHHVHEEVCAWGGRASGKTILVGAALAILAERHGRAGHAWPLRCLWLHSSLRDAEMKTARSLTEPLWGGRWRIEASGTTAVFSVGGADMVSADFTATRDPEAQERVRSAAHVVACEEPIASLAETGIAVDRYGLALTSTRRHMPTPRRVSIVSTNPGSKTHWVAQRFIEIGHPAWCTAVKVSNRERNTPEQLAAMAADFVSSPALRSRLVGEEWVDLPKGPLVTPDFDPVRHVAEKPLYLVPNAPLVLGWDSGVTTNVSACVVIQRNGRKVHIFASLIIENLGLRRLINDRVIPWLRARAPWMLNRENARAWLQHGMDPSMRPSKEAYGKDLDLNPERLLMVLLGGHTHAGTNAWAPRIAPLLYTLSPTTDTPLVIDPGPDTEIIRRLRRPVALRPRAGDGGRSTERPGEGRTNFCRRR